MDLLIILWCEGLIQNGLNLEVVEDVTSFIPSSHFFYSLVSEYSGQTPLSSQSVPFSGCSLPSSVLTFLLQVLLPIECKASTSYP